MSSLILTVALMGHCDAQCTVDLPVLAAVVKTPITLARRGLPGKSVRRTLGAVCGVVREGLPGQPVRRVAARVRDRVKQRPLVRRVRGGVGRLLCG